MNFKIRLPHLRCAVLCCASSLSFPTMASDDAMMGYYMSQLLNNDEPSSYPEDQRLQKLEKKISRRDEIIADMLNSTSWRVSAPIRWLKQSLVQIRKRFPG